MAEQRVQRRLAAILAADVVGYSRLMGADEAGTLQRLKALREEVFNPRVEEYGGRIVKLMGDGILIEFPSAVDAVQYAIDVQQAVALRNKPLTEDRQINLRMGINLGDVIVDGDDIYGDGVNIAARLEAFSEPGKICISAMVHEGVRGKLNITFADLGEQSLKNIAEPVHVYGVVPGPAAGGAEAADVSGALMRRPAIAVLPFENMSGDPEQEYFADGLTEDIITALSLWRAFPVIARNSTFAYKGQAPDVRKVGEELGARYVVEGSVRRAGNRVRVTAQLINTETGHHIWAERFDRQLDDIFALQDEITTRISATVGPQLTLTELSKAHVQRPRNLGVWELFHRGMGHLQKMTAEDNKVARAYFEEAIDLEPDYSPAYYGLAFGHHRDIYLDVADDRQETLRQVFVFVGRAIALDETNSDAHHLMSIANVWARNFEEAIAEAERAITLNPSSANGYFTKGAALNFSGHAAEAIPVLEQGFALNPIDPHRNIHLCFLARAHLNLGDFETAANVARRALRHQPEDFEAQLIYVATLGHLGRVEEARDMIREWGDVPLRDVENRPLVQIFKRDEDRDIFLAGLAKAGVAA